MNTKLFLSFSSTTVNFKVFSKFQFCHKFSTSFGTFDNNIDNSIKSKVDSKKTSSIFTKKLPLIPVYEHDKYNHTLHKRTLFPIRNTSRQSALSRVVVSFRFRSIEFSKKRALPFFIARELLTNRKCVASLSKQNVQVWKIRKGRLVGCKVTLRHSGLYEFVDTLSLTFPRREKFQPSRWRIKQFKYFYSKTSFRKRRIIHPTYALSLGELVLFYPIELGLGLHPDVQRVEFNFVFASFSIEERFFLLRSFKIPILYLS